MKIIVNKPYLALSLNNDAPLQRVVMSHEGKEVWALDAHVCTPPAYSCWLDVRRFMGMQLEVNLPEDAFSLTDELPKALYRESLRPQTHFSARTGWINDPNGLVYHNGVYHLFFQHNPAGNQWGNMHWGHAVSRDLVHWTQEPIALYPDALGTMFSGSAVVDERNVSGFGKGALLLFYTAAGDPFTQCLAWSTDGKQFRKYEGNPIVPHIAGANRDPKVIWCEELGCYVMALYLENNTYTLLLSDDLLRWREHQRIELPGDSECPDFYPLLEEESGERFWIFSGASDRYLVGRFRDGLYVPEYSGALHDGPNVLYAAQTFSGIGGRRIRVSWNTANMQGMPFNCCISTPVEMRLRRIDGQIRLCAFPIPEFLEGLRDDENPAAWRLELELSGVSGASRLKIFDGEAIALDGAPVRDGRLHVTVIADRSGYEAYFGQGEYILARGADGHYGLDREPASCIGGECAVCCTGLASIWNKE